MPEPRNALSSEERSRLTHLNACLEEVEAYCLNATRHLRNIRGEKAKPARISVCIRLHLDPSIHRKGGEPYASEALQLDDKASNFCQGTDAFRPHCDPDLPRPICWLMLAFHGLEPHRRLTAVKRPARELARVRAVSVSLNDAPPAQFCVENAVPMHEPDL